MHTLSIVIPCYNEEKTIEKCLDKVLEIASSDLNLEIIIVDDYSKDQSLDIIKGYTERDNRIKLAQHEENMGKGAALRTGFIHATGDFVAIQDADLEYDPQDLLKLIEPLKSGRAEVCLGSRFLSSEQHRALSFWHSIGNKFLTLCSNVCSDLYLTDMETCYKVFKREIIQSIEIEENRFGFEPEVVAKIAALKVNVFEIGISYYGRSYNEGKKIGPKDGIRAIYCIFKYNFRSRALPVQAFMYMFIGAFSAIFNIGIFSYLYAIKNYSMNISAPVSFLVAAFVNYIFCIFIFNRPKSKLIELFLYLLIIAIVCALDWYVVLPHLEIRN
ncbi:MAG: bifunctional glycosyltransferase family 2/GtrA family protein [Lentisphaeraceae bacterium]|nr:bifunctional glycosyltransferase family 2/GtrA family protein [Lentisphaeraceae bacterium]